jgi:molybdopterin/thiamine biosynthesis adenylyltransferase
MLDERYSRHGLIDWFSQERVQSARFIVIGAGAIGNEVIKNLALLGAGRIDIHDFDHIERHNLTRSVLFREDDVGRTKAEVAAERARALDPAVDARAVPGDFWTTLGFDALRAADAVIGCVDNFEARIRLSRLCRLAGVNLIDAAVDTRYACVELYPFALDGDAACYECTLPPGVYARMAQRFSCAGLRRRGMVERTIPTTILTSSLAGALAVSAAMRLLHGTQAGPSRRIMADTVGGQTTAPLARNPCCPGCGDLFGTIRIVAADPVVAPPRWAIDPTVALRFSDPMISRARCSACGHDLDAGGPRRLRLARAHDERLSVCPACGGAMAVELRDQFGLDELAAEFAGARIPARLAVVDTAEASVVLDFLGQGGGEGESAATDPS